MNEAVELPGEKLITMLNRSKDRVLIVAPFIRSEALVRLLDSIPQGVSTSVVTRWLPADLLAGASDLDVFDLTQERSIPLLLRNDLHAKLYAADDECFIGSANVTLTALGWRSPTNLELLLAVPRSRSSIATFEKQLFTRTIPATKYHRDCLQDFLNDFEEQPGFTFSQILNKEHTPQLVVTDWVPHIRNPEELYYVYNGNIDKVNQTALPQMQKELACLAVPPHMSLKQFTSWVGASIAQVPLVSKFINHVNQNQSMSEAIFIQLLEETGVDPNRYPAYEGLQVFQRWLAHFLNIQLKMVRDSVKLVPTN